MPKLPKCRITANYQNLNISYIKISIHQNTKTSKHQHTKAITNIKTSQTSKHRNVTNVTKHQNINSTKTSKIHHSNIHISTTHTKKNTDRILQLPEGTTRGPRPRPLARWSVIASGPKKSPVVITPTQRNRGTSPASFASVRSITPRWTSCFCVWRPWYSRRYVSPVVCFKLNCFATEKTNQPTLSHLLVDCPQLRACSPVSPVAVVDFCFAQHVVFLTFFPFCRDTQSNETQQTMHLLLKLVKEHKHGT